jgi:predicted nucleotidyltransferase
MSARGKPGTATGIGAPAERRGDYIHPGPIAVAPAFDSTEILDILRKSKGILKEKYFVEEIAVFGSYATVEHGQDSDLDVLVQFSRPVGLFHFIELEDYLSALLGIKVDLVSKKALKPRIGRNILNEMVNV